MREKLISWIGTRQKTFYFCGVPGTIQEQLLSNYKYNTTSLKDKYIFTVSNKLIPSEYIDILIA